jgi:hypothetical protein
VIRFEGGNKARSVIFLHLEVAGTGTGCSPSESRLADPTVFSASMIQDVIFAKQPRRGRNCAEGRSTIVMTCIILQYMTL